MASLSKDPNGNRSIQFVSTDQKRRTVRLGRVSQRVAESIKVRVEQLVACARAKLPWDGDLAAWVGGIGDELAGRLSRAGLIPARRGGPNATLGAFVDTYIEGRTDAKPLTVRNLVDCAARLKEYFGSERSLTTVTAGDADAFCIWLKGRYADATASRTIGRAKQFFRSAQRKKLIGENPFADAKQPSQVNTKRQAFVTRETTQKVIDACPNAEWRLIVALCRYAGIRCPSELLGLRWDEVLWGEGKLLVRSPKTERHSGGDERWVPIFPELRPHLEESFDQAAPGTVFMVERANGTSTNLRTRFERIIRRAGVSPWPKLFVNLRSSRETELVKEYPLHVVCAWIGNSALIAQRHYLQITDEDFQRASGILTQTCRESGTQSAAKSGASALQNPVQSGDDEKCQQMTTEAQDLAKQELVQLLSSAVNCVQSYTLPRSGLEPIDASSFPDNDLQNEWYDSAAKSGAVDDLTPTLDLIVEAMLSLPPDQRRKIASLLDPS